MHKPSSMNITVGKLLEDQTCIILEMFYFILVECNNLLIVVRQVNRSSSAILK
jgi:hypothetical protein